MCFNADQRQHRPPLGLYGGCSDAGGEINHVQGGKPAAEIKYQPDYSSTRTLNKRNPNYSHCAHYHQIGISFKRALACAVSYLVLNNPRIKLEIAGGSFLHSCT